MKIKQFLSFNLPPFALFSGYPNEIAKVKGNAGVSMHIADLFTISIIENIVGPRSVYSSNPLGEVDGYFTTNLVFSTHKLFNDRMSASINIRNLTNQTYFDPGWIPNTNLCGTVHEQMGINGLFKITVSIF